MRTDVFQAVALSCHANAYLDQAADPGPELLHNSTFEPVHEIDFARTASGRLNSGVVADSPGPWLRRLNKEGVVRFGISLASCPFDPLVLPSEPWGILSDGDIGVEIWTPSWKKRIRSHGDASPWKVTYSASRAGRWVTQVPYSVDEMERLLDSAIKQTSMAHSLLRSLEAPGESPFPDMFPPCWPERHRDLGDLAARIAALLRSEEWAGLVARRQMNSSDHDQISQRLWLLRLRHVGSRLLRNIPRSKAPG